MESLFLKKVPMEKAFYFYNSIDSYTGVSASSLEEFLEKNGSRCGENEEGCRED